MKALSALLLLLAVTGCATSQTAATFTNAPVPEIQQDRAILYIFRNYAEPTAFSSYLEMDKVEVATLNQQGFTWIYVTPGEHAFTFGWPFMAGMPKVEFKESFEAGKVYAFQMGGSVTMQGSTVSAGSAIKPMSIEAATEQMTACCRYVPAKYKGSKQ